MDFSQYSGSWQQLVETSVCSLIRSTVLNTLHLTTVSHLVSCRLGSLWLVWPELGVWPYDPTNACLVLRWYLKLVALWWNKDSLWNECVSAIKWDYWIYCHLAFWRQKNVQLMNELMTHLINGGSHCVHLSKICKNNIAYLNLDKI